MGSTSGGLSRTRVPVNTWNNDVSTLLVWPTRLTWLDSSYITVGAVAELHAIDGVTLNPSGVLEIATAGIYEIDFNFYMNRSGGSGERLNFDARLEASSDDVTYTHLHGSYGSTYIRGGASSGTADLSSSGVTAMHGFIENNTGIKYVRPSINRVSQTDVTDTSVVELEIAVKKLS